MRKKSRFRTGSSKRRTVAVHKHRLQLIDKQEEVIYWCAACEEQLSGQKIYRCDRCISFFHEECANLPPEIKTFFHPCPLFLCKSSSFTCNSCFGYRFPGFSYLCGKCDFDMDVGCALKALAPAACEGGEQKEQILHCCHSHPLQPLSFKTETKSACRICDIGPLTPTIWGCEPCNFQVHKSCLDLLPQTIEINLDSEVANWVLVTTTYKKCIECREPVYSNLAFRRIKKFKYLCISCCLVHKMVEESNFQVSKVVNHFLHPCPLKLVLGPLDKNNFYYHCKQCGIFLDFECIHPSIVSGEEEANQIGHFCHAHPLKLVTRATDRNTLCKACQNPCYESFYGCIECQFYIHKYCMDILPQEIFYPLLKQRMVLLPGDSIDPCTACKRASRRLQFRCMKTWHNFCVRCAFSLGENKFDDSGRFKSIHHWHQLTSKYIDKARCFMCRDYCSGWTYNCEECNIFFHKSCAELPQQFQHSIHPSHPLNLAFNLKPYRFAAMKCVLCLGTYRTHYNGFYHCNECNFFLDIRCVNLLPSVEYPGHPHLLCVVENLHEKSLCNLCKSSCKGCPVLRCAECDFNLHLLCGPLPSIIKDACHVHPLAIQDYYLEDNASDEFACHVCEEKRDPRLRIYRCVEECLMICEVKCVLPEVIASLRGERGVTELETMYPKMACKLIFRDSDFKEIAHAKGGKDENVTVSKDVFSFNELKKSICSKPESESTGEETLSNESESESEEDRFSFRPDSIFRAASLLGIAETSEEDEDVQNGVRIGISTNSASNNEDETNSLSSLHGDKPVYSYSRRAFQSFTEQLDQGSWWDEDIFKKHDGSIMAGIYLLPEALISVYEDFFGKYPFVPAWYNLGYIWRRYIVFIICSILHEMRMTKVVDVPRNRIRAWLHRLEMLEEFDGVKVLNLDFLIQHIRRIERAHFIVQAKDIVDAKSSKLRKEKEELSATLEELIRKQKEIEMKLQQNEKEWKEHGAYRAAGASELKQEYYDALEIKWRTCYEFNVDYSKRA